MQSTFPAPGVALMTGVYQDQRHQRGWRERDDAQLSRRLEGRERPVAFSRVAVVQDARACRAEALSDRLVFGLQKLERIDDDETIGAGVAHGDRGFAILGELHEARAAKGFAAGQRTGLVELKARFLVADLHQQRDFRGARFVRGISNAQVVATGARSFETEDRRGLAVAGFVVVEIAATDVRFEIRRMIPGTLDLRVGVIKDDAGKVFGIDIHGAFRLGWKIGQHWQIEDLLLRQQPLA